MASVAARLHGVSRDSFRQRRMTFGNSMWRILAVVIGGLYEKTTLVVFRRGGRPDDADRARWADWHFCAGLDLQRVGADRNTADRPGGMEGRKRRDHRHTGLP